MPKTKKQASSSDSDSGPEDRNVPAEKKSKAKTSEPDAKRPKFADGEDCVSWELEKNRFVKVREFHGKVLVDIREFYEKDGKLLPGKKGISLSGPQFKKFCDILDEIKEEVKNH